MKIETPNSRRTRGCAACGGGRPNRKLGFALGHAVNGNHTIVLSVEQSPGRGVGEDDRVVGSWYEEDDRGLPPGAVPAAYK